MTVYSNQECLNAIVNVENIESIRYSKNAILVDLDSGEAYSNFHSNGDIIFPREDVGETSVNMLSMRLKDNNVVNYLIYQTYDKINNNLLNKLSFEDLKELCKYNDSYINEDFKDSEIYIRVILDLYL